MPRPNKANRDGQSPRLPVGAHGESRGAHASRGGTLAGCPRARGQFGERIRAKLSPCFCSCSPLPGAHQSPLFLSASGRPGLTHTATWTSLLHPMRYVVRAHLLTKRFHTWPFRSSHGEEKRSRGRGRDEGSPARAAVTHALDLEPMVCPNPSRGEANHLPSMLTVVLNNIDHGPVAIHNEVLACWISK